MYFIDIFRSLHPKAVKYVFFSSAHVTFSRIDPILGHETFSGSPGSLESPKEVGPKEEHTKTHHD